MNVCRNNDVALHCSNHCKFEISIEEQLERLKKYCKHFGFNIVKEYIDDNVSNNESFNQMIEDVKLKKFNIVVSYSFDTLPHDEDTLYNLVGELFKYKYELHLESSFIYSPGLNPLFKLQRNDEILEKDVSKKSKKKSNVCPAFKFEEVQNPKSTEVYNWVDLIDEDNFRYDDFPMFDQYGNYLGMHRDVYVIFKKLIGFHRISANFKSDKWGKNPYKLF